LRILRWSRVAAYMLVALAGAISVVLPPASVAQATGGYRLVQLVWAGLMAVAAGFCAWGAATDRWVGEYVGLIPLAAVAAVFGISSLARGHVGWPGGLFLLGFFLILVSRWQEVALLRAEAERLTRAQREGEVPDAAREESA
jgi:hypothetical protein